VITLGGIFFIFFINQRILLATRGLATVSQIYYLTEVGAQA